MPNNVQPANPTVVMPYSLSTAFTEEQRIEALISAYQSGFSTRAALAINPRRFWKLSKALTAAQFTALRTFFYQNSANPFWFYNPRETVPPFTNDPTGASTFGRYAVVFDGDWAESVSYPRMAVGIALREVA